jgi:hypothetical protein
MPDVTKTATVADDAVDTPSVAQDAVAPQQEKARSLWGDAWRDLRRNPYFIVSSVLIFLLLLIAAFPGMFTSASPTAGDLVKHYVGKPDLANIGSEGWLGYDIQGRSVYARLIYGTRASIIVGVVVTLIVTIVGGIMGMIAGYFGGIIDAVLSRVTDIFFGIPFLLGAMVVLQSFAERTFWVVVFDHGQAGGLRARGEGAGRRHHPDPVPAHPAERHGSGDRRRHHRAGRIHLGRGHPVVPRSGPRRPDRLVGCRRLRRCSGHPDVAAHPAVPVDHAERHRPGVHHARRSGP